MSQPRHEQGASSGENRGLRPRSSSSSAAITHGAIVAERPKKGKREEELEAHGVLCRTAGKDTRPNLTVWQLWKASQPLSAAHAP
jgi:hypothetical protein